MKKQAARNNNRKPAKLTEIAVILDRSGSMASIKDDMEGGLWAMITEQHGAPGSCRVSLYEFDDEFEVRFEGRDSGSIRAEDCRLVPRGTTALNDAVVKALASLEARILGEKETERPDVVSVLVITDGHENASRENSTDDARKAIQRAADKLGWHFAFLAADPDGFADGEALIVGVVCASAGTYDRTDPGEAAARYSESLLDVREGRAASVDVSRPRTPAKGRKKKGRPRTARPRT